MPWPIYALAQKTGLFVLLSVAGTKAFHEDALSNGQAWNRLEGFFPGTKNIGKPLADFPTHGRSPAHGRAHHANYSTRGSSKEFSSLEIKLHPGVYLVNVEVTNIDTGIAFLSSIA